MPKPYHTPKSERDEARGRTIEREMREAMGDRGGDELVLMNQWESVRITLCEDDQCYYIDGSDESRQAKHMNEALRIAARILARFERGRCD